MSQDLPERTKLILAAQNKSTVSIVITSSDAEDHFAFGREDYTPETMAIANAQAVGVTEEAKNSYTLRVGHRIRTLEVNGYPAVIENGGPGGARTFSNEFDAPGDAPARSAFEASSNSRTLGLNVIKGKALPTSEVDFNYMELLQEVTSNPNENRLAVAIENQSKATNQSFPSKPHLTIGQKEKDTTIGKVVLQNLPGIHSPKNTDESITSVELKLQTLKNLGLQMMLKANGEYTSLTNEDDFAQTLVTRASSLAPGVARMGAKIPMAGLRPQNIVLEANPDFTQNDSNLLQDEGTLTNGSYNSPLVPFNGIDTRSTIAAATILISTVSLLFEALSRAFDPRNGLQSPLFQSISNQVTRITTPTSRDYGECVRMGLAVFFGNSSGDIGSIVGSGFEKLNESPGYYNTILRNIIQSLTYEIGQALFAAAVPPGVIDSFVGPLNTNSATNIRPAGLSMDVGSNLMNAFARISQSRVVGFMNVMANIGDIYLSLRANDLIGENGKVTSFDTHIVDIVDGIDGSKVYNPAASPRRDRITKDANSILNFPSGKVAMAWAGSTTPSKFILPESITVAANALGGSGAHESLNAKLSSERGMTTIDGNRLPQEMVEELESTLDSSYVPFYFHDLRTNEIVSFHAFLTDMADGFTAEYSETSGYGRIGKVHTYKNTDRAISLGFMVVATNPTDFDRMWWKINKLVTTVYPQYTAGRTLEYQGEKFIQPFSQLPSASPLIRLRLGDVWKSNYSKFSLARLFGLGQGQDQFSLNQQNIDNARQGTINYRNALQAVRTRMAGNDFSVNERFYLQYTAPAATGRQARRTTPTMPLGAPEADYVLHRVPEESTNVSPSPSPAGTSSGQQTQSLASGRYLMRVVSKQEVDGTSATAPAAGAGSESVTSNTVMYKLQIDDAPSNSRSVQYFLRLPRSTNSHSAVPHEGAMITLFDADVEAAARQQAGSATLPITGSQEQQTTENTVQAFFASEGTNANPVFKAFETTKGKGLAGFIKSLSFDWADSPWEVDSYGGKAPMMLKVSIAFAPIHDITPGIDSNGFNTSPVYGIGDISNATNTSIGDDKESNLAARARYSTLISSINPNRQS